MDSDSTVTDEEEEDGYQEEKEKEEPPPDEEELTPIMREYLRVLSPAKVGMLWGVALRSHINKGIRPHTDLPYARARVPIMNADAPDVYGNEVEDDTSTEHVVCQSFFDYREPYRGDMHHLFECDGRLNSHRNNYKFVEIDDDEAEFIDPDGNKIPKPEIQAEADGLSEKHSATKTFEPRKGSKGNVARAIAYFVTAYPELFEMVFERCIDSVYLMVRWHEEDPVDEWERQHNALCFEHQHNINPYIMGPPNLMRQAFADYFVE